MMTIARTSLQKIRVVCDVYMDLTFLEVMQKEGINAPAESFAKAFANADYKLWHANQAARYNILHGIMPPASRTLEK